MEPELPRARLQVGSLDTMEPSSFLGGEGEVVFVSALGLLSIEPRGKPHILQHETSDSLSHTIILEPRAAWALVLCS